VKRRKGKIKPFQLRILYTEKQSLKNKGEVKALADK
jgi:hypothetical protein